ncbi:hypothetical protein LSAT2_031763, partial [Lamellibrachia satsuma]
TRVIQRSTSRFALPTSDDRLSQLLDSTEDAGHGSSRLYPCSYTPRVGSPTATRALVQRFGFIQGMPDRRRNTEPVEAQFTQRCGQ